MQTILLDDTDSRVALTGGPFTVLAQGGDDEVDLFGPHRDRASFIDLGAGNDHLYDTYVDCTVLGGDGDDVFDVFRAFCTLRGGAGNDVMVVAWDPDQGVLGDFRLSGGAGLDCAMLDLYRLGPVHADFSDGRASASGGVFISLRGLESVSLDFGDSDDWVKGPSNSFASLNGGGGNDTLVASSEGSNLSGGTGDDRLLVGSGVDGLTGAEGRDRMTGGGGGDYFLIYHDAMANAFDRDLITDFSASEGDMIWLLPWTSACLTFHGDAPMSGAVGEVVFSWRGTPDHALTRISVDLDGDARADLHVALCGWLTLTEADFFQL